MRSRVALAALLVLVSWMLGGCATHALWDNHAFAGFNEPARPANLQVFKTPNDWLIQYDEVNENSGHISRRAYYLKPNSTPTASRKMPRFVTPVESPPFATVPVCARVGSAMDANSVYAVMTADSQGFALYQGNTKLGAHELPVYPAPAGRVQQVLLTPWTLVADCTIVGGVIAVYWWLPAGAPGLGE